MVANRYAGGLRLVHSAQWTEATVPVARLGADLVPAGRVVLARYHCAQGHENLLPIAVNEHTPLEWDCRCGRMGQLSLPEQEDAHPGGATVERTHWDRVRQRRAPAELQALLDARLDELRSSRGDGTNSSARARLIG